MTPVILYRNGRVHSPADPNATALLVREGTIAWLGPDADAPGGADETVDLAGRLVAPAFVDSHVHATSTGLALLGLDLSDTRSAGDVIERLAKYAAKHPADRVVIGHGWDESGWPVREPPSAEMIGRAAEGRPVYLSRVDAHSAVVSSALLAMVRPEEPGWDPAGWLRLSAHHAVRRVALSSVSGPQRQAAQEAALRHAASLGIAAVHECGGRDISSEDDLAALLALGGRGLPEVYGYWGELGGARTALELGAAGAAGDLFADGALGSHTAHLRTPYIDGNGSGNGYLSAEEVGAHLVECTELGLQGGFHAIGDKAVATVLAGFALAATKVGVERLRAARHRVEHLEILDKQLIAGLVAFGVTASMQPAFDRLWGGADGMYAGRLGTARALDSNPFAALAGVGVPLAFGSDSPVTPLDPWGTIRAAMTHHNPAHRVGFRTAFAAHTRGGWRAARRDDEGVLAPGAPATFAVWDSPGLPALVPSAPDEPVPPLPTCLRTVLRGEVIYEAT
jgi:predicted amidohydrolase YtcJ